MIVNKIGVSPRFTSKVNIVYEDENEYLMKKFYKNKNFKNEVKKLENNGDNNTVTLYPYGYLCMGMQIEEIRNGKKYYASTLVIDGPERIAPTYNMTYPGGMEPKSKYLA